MTELTKREKDWQRTMEAWELAKQDMSEDFTWAGQRLKKLYWDYPIQGANKVSNFTTDVMKNLFDNIDDWQSYATDPNGTIQQYLTNHPILGLSRQQPQDMQTPQQKTIMGEEHELSYITPEEGEILKAFGGAGVDSDDDGVKEYWDIFSGISDFFGGSNPANASNNDGNWFGADTWTYGADDKGEGGFTLRTPEAANNLPSDHPDHITDDQLAFHQNPHGHSSGHWNDNNNNSSNNNNNTSPPPPPSNPYNMSTLSNEYGNLSDTLAGADMYDMYGTGFTPTATYISSAIDDLQGALDSGSYTNTSDIQSLLNQYQGLDNIRSGLETNLHSAIAGNQNALLDYNKEGDLAAIDIAGLGNMDATGAQALKTQLQKDNIDFKYDTGLDHTLLGLTGNANPYNTTYQSNIAALDNIIGNYNTATTGVTDAWSNLDTAGLNETISNLNLNDPAGAKAQLNQIVQQIETIGNNSGLTDAQIQTLYEQSGVSNAMAKANAGIQAAEAARAAEQQRIQSAVAQELADAQSISGQVLGANPYSKAALDSLQSQITGGLGDISGFQSSMPFDFSGATSEYTNAQNYLNEILAERTRNLKNIKGDISDAYSGFSGLNLWEEDAFNRIKRDLGFAGDDLGMYSGGTVDDIYGDLDTYTKNVDDKLFELGQYRGGLEDSAVDFLSRLEGANTNRELYDQYSDEWNPIADEISQYRAQQAYDERGDIVAELSNRLKTIEQDEQNVADRMTRASSDLNDYQFADYRLVDPLSTINTGYGLYNEDEEELMAGNNIGSAFSQNILRF
mgnify:CR=1 FL=1